MWHKVGRVADLPENDMVAVDVADTEILLARVDGELYALENLCTHAEAWLDMGTLLCETCEVQCPLHEGRFDLKSGKPTHDPCTEPVASYPVEVRGEDVYIMFPAEP